MELLLLPSPSRATVSRPALLPAAPLRRAFRPSATSGNVEAGAGAGVPTTATTASSSGGGAANADRRQGWRAGGGLGLDLSEEMRREMAWRMLALPAAAVAAEAALLRLLELDGGAPAWAGKAGSAVLFAAGLLGSQYGFFSSRWDTAEKGSVVGWELAVRHWGALSMARGSSVEEEDEDDELGEDEEWEYYEEEED